MSKPLTAAELRALEPRYTIGGLFESGKLGKADEEALSEIVALKAAFGRWVNPARGWMSPRMGDAMPAVPRQLAHSFAWNRYTTWRKRWAFRVIPASPSFPWGMTAAGLIVELATEPANFNELAAVTRTSALRLVELFIAAVRDYGRSVPAPISRDLLRIWQADPDVPAYAGAELRPPPTAEQLKRRAQARARKRRQRAKRKADA